MRRPELLHQLNDAFAVHPVVAILGPRQCGKTTLAKQYLAETHTDVPKQNYFDLEDETDIARLAHPKLTLENLEGLIVIDEIQKVPELFPTLRVLVDNDKGKRRFLILGSASRTLIHQSSESLAGRIQYIELTPFSWNETHDLNGLLLKGGFPLSYLAKNDEQSFLWRKAYIKTFLEQDIPNLGISIPAQNMRRFWMMLAHHHGAILNASELGRSLGISQKVVRHYLDILVGTFMMRELQPWHENISKRQVRSPKIYFRDSGIFHALLGISDSSDLLTHSKLGASWEGMALEEIIRHTKVDAEDCYFWSTHAHAELDLLIFKNNKRLGFEFKYTDAPKLTKSMTIAGEDLKLDELTIISPGGHDFPLPHGIRACGLEAYLKG
jgi:predicted AAA+ superfamily ATPase